MINLFFSDEEEFRDFHSKFKSVLINLEESEKNEGNIIYLPRESLKGDFSRAFISINLKCLEEFEFIKQYKMQKVEKPDNI